MSVRVLWPGFIVGAMNEYLKIAAIAIVAVAAARMVAGYVPGLGKWLA